jgi:hypothetical protein
VATIGVRGFASLMVVVSLVMGVGYLMVRRDQKIGRVLQDATEKLRGVRG